MDLVRNVLKSLFWKNSETYKLFAEVTGNFMT